MKPNEIANTAAILLRKRAEKFNLQFQVPADMIYRDEDGLWHVYVEHTAPIKARGEFNDVLNEIEEEFKSAHQENVMIVPVAPERKTA